MAKIDSGGARRGNQERGDGLTKAENRDGEDYDGWLVGCVIRPYAMCSVYIIMESLSLLPKKASSIERLIEKSRRTGLRKRRCHIVV